MIRALLVCVALLLTSSGLVAQGRGERFDGDRLSARDVRFLQGALTLQGAYEGMLDGDWGRLSREALDRYLSRETARRAEAAVAELARDFQDEVDRNGWTVRDDNATGLSYLLPTRLMSRVELTGVAQRILSKTGDVKSWASEDGGLRLTRIEEESAGKLRDRHEALVRRHTPPDEPYTLRGDRRWITTAEDAEGRRFYLLSVAAGNSWVSYEIRAQEPNWNRLSLIAGSFLRAPGLALSPQPGGRLERLMARRADAPTPPSPIEVLPLPRPVPRERGDRDRRPRERTARGGSGVYVNAVDLVTAAPVLRGCSEPQLDDGSRLRLLDRNETLGVAVLTGDRRSRDWIALDRRSDLREGDAVLTVGHGAGETGLVTAAGRVIATAEARAGAAARLVIDARLPAGLTGGPVVDGEGHVQGIVVSQPDLMQALSEGGAIGADTALAVPAAVLAEYLRDRAVTLDRPRGRDSIQERSRTLRAATVAIRCGAF